MSTMNRLANCKNHYQTKAKRVLCLCSAGLLRSPTTANVLHQEYGYNTRAAGVSKEYALIPVDEVLLQWADEVVCVEPYIKQELLRTYPEMREAKVVVLNIPDRFEWNDEELRETIKKQYDDVAIMERASVQDN